MKLSLLSCALLVALNFSLRACFAARVPPQPSLLFKGGEETVRFRKLHDKEPDQETFETPFNQAMNSIHEHVEQVRQPDDYGSLGLPPRSSHIVIDGASVAWSYGQRMKFSCLGLKKVIDFFLDQGYQHVIALVGYAYTQEPPKGSNRTRVADDPDALLAMKLHGHALLMPPGANEESMVLQYAFMRGGFVVSNNDFSDFKRSCTKEEEEWVRTHHLYFTWVEGEFLPMCDRDDKPPKPLSSSEDEGDAADGEAMMDRMEDADEQGNDMANGGDWEQGEEADPFLSWRALVPDGGVGLLRKLSPLSLFHALKAKRLDLLDETTLQRLISISQHAAATREEGAANVAYLEGRFGVVDSVDDEVLVQGGMLEEETAMEMSGELVALASPDLLRGRILPVGTSVEFDAVCDLSLGKWIVTRLVRTGCVKEQEERLTAATCVLAGLLGHASVEDMSAFWRQHGPQDLTAVSMQLEGRVFSTSHLLMNKAYFCRGLSAPACLQELFEPDAFVTDSARKVGLPTTVEEFFRSRHSPLAFPHLPCLCAVASDGLTILFFPLEVCRIQFMSPLQSPAAPLGSFQQGLRPPQNSAPQAHQKHLFEKLEEYFKRQEELVSKSLHHADPSEGAEAGERAGARAGAGAVDDVRKQSNYILRKLRKAIDKHTMALEKRLFDIQMNQAMEVDQHVKTIMDRDNLTLADCKGNVSDSVEQEEEQEEQEEEHEGEDEEDEEEGLTRSDVLDSSLPSSMEVAGERNRTRHEELEERLQRGEKTISQLKDELRRRDAVVQSLTDMLHDASKGRPSVRARIRRELQNLTSSLRSVSDVEE
ncbi:hypothetical protein GUITHDRAFT_107796 [Guillardia theta CCMP2712]|uniref:RNase NYN domain-containing protein n=1 Tax=Guillardia theta (strain CCMP2712) TaxID=905079 RepID=L1JDI8_GUITC|nr:hypothetical protein GUITHDRAFT_107796 [Guillardia theta CCMP2712]EKX46179.1 hypothetical protein GUITHDRAFT_107796 [Guillardia theta CCMP2712]|eukprot:XP_005833159.1 hypothetical protein GUITHDRAFT_107796 [Guillardia theta CCMP2712]